MAPSGSICGPLGGFEQLLSRGGETIRVEVTDARIAIIVDAPSGELVARVTIPYPSAGYGGHELLLSAEERYLAMFLYSGQSEVGYEVFSFRPALRHICGLPYVVGEGLGPVFSPDERLLGLAWATNPTLDLTDMTNKDGDAVAAIECVADWAELRVHELPDGPATTCTIQVRVPPAFPLEGDESYYPEQLEFVSSNEVRFRTVWGELVRVPLPLPASLLVPGPRTR